MHGTYDGIIYTDGSCWPTAGGPGGYAAIAIVDDVEHEITGGCSSTTNNRMELMAVLEGLKHFKTVSRIAVFSDSQYVVKGAGSWVKGEAVPQHSGWMVKWKLQGWHVGSDYRVNHDLWKQVYAEVIKHELVFMNWVKGHSGDTLNERCDRLCLEQRLLHTPTVQSVAQEQA